MDQGEDPLNPPHPLYPPLLLDVTEGTQQRGQNTCLGGGLDCPRLVCFSFSKQKENLIVRTYFFPLSRGTEGVCS